MPSRRPVRRTVQLVEPLEQRTLLSVAFGATGSTSDPNLLAMIGQAQTADIDGDGKTDVVVGANTAGSTTSLTGTDLLLGTGSNGFTVSAGPVFPAGSASSTNVFSLGDLNGDNKPDLLYAGQSADANLDAVVTPELNTAVPGAPAFTAGGAFTITNPVDFNPQQVVTADFNGDGHLDAAILGLTGNAEAIVVLNGDGAGGFTESYHAAVEVVGGTPLSDGVLFTGDFNGDAKPDLAVYDPGSGDVTFLRNTGSSFSQTASPLSLNSTGYTPGPVTAADLTDDGKTDLIVGENSNAGGTDTVAVFRATGAGGSVTFAAETPVPAGNPAGELVGGVATGDFDGDGHVDVATDYGVLLGDGTGTLASPAPALASTSLTGTQGYTALLAGDLNGDGKPDLIGINQANHTIVAALNASTVTVTSVATTTTLATSKASIAAGDAVTFTATVSSASGTPTGYVNILSGSRLIGSAALETGGIATLSTTALASGTDSITAVYLGGGNFLTSTSPAVTETVTGSSSGTGGGGPVSTPVTLPDTSTLHPSLSALKFPAQEVADQKINLIVPVIITNTAAVYTGAATVTLYASDAAGFDGSQQVVQTALIKRLDLRTGRSATVRLHVTKLPAGLTGTVYLVATVADSSGNATGVASATSSTVAAPFTAINTELTTLHSSTAVVGGSRTAAFAIVTLRNTGNVVYAGRAAISLLASPSRTVASHAAALNTVTIARLVLKPNVPRRIRVPLRNNPSAVVSTVDYILAQTTDASANVTAGPSSTTITVAPPFVSLAGSMSPTMTTVTAGRRTNAALLLTLTNNGNIAATGVASFAIFASSTPALAAGSAALPTVSLKLSIAPGRARRVRLPITTLSQLPAGTYYLIVRATGLSPNQVMVTAAAPITIVSA